MNKNFSLSFLHCHFELIFLVVESIDVVGGFIEGLFDFFNLQFHDIVLDKNFFLGFSDFI